MYLPKFGCHLQFCYVACRGNSKVSWAFQRPSVIPPLVVSTNSFLGSAFYDICLMVVSQLCPSTRSRPSFADWFRGSRSLRASLLLKVKLWILRSRNSFCRSSDLISILFALMFCWLLGAPPLNRSFNPFLFAGLDVRGLAPSSEEAFLRDLRSRIGFADPTVCGQVCCSKLRLKCFVRTIFCCCCVVHACHSLSSVLEFRGFASSPEEALLQDLRSRIGFADPKFPVPVP